MSNEEGKAHYCPPHIFVSGLKDVSTFLTQCPSSFPSTTSSFLPSEISDLINLLSLDVIKRPVPIHILPRHLFEYILELSRPDSSSKGEEDEAWQRTQWLLEASYVCRAWKSVAQSLLWRKIEILEEKSVKKLLESGLLGKVETVSLSVRTKDERDVVWKVLLGMVGLEELEWSHQNYVDLVPLDWLAELSLKDINSLTLHSPKFAQRDLSNPNSLLSSFSLRTLTLEGPPQYLPSLAHFPRQPSLTSLFINLDLRQKCSVTDTTIFSTPFFDTLVPQLLHLHYRFSAKSLRTKGAHLILPSIPLCTSLRHLEIDCKTFELLELFRSLPTPPTIRHLHLLGRSTEFMETWVEAVTKILEEESAGALDMWDWDKMMKEARFVEAKGAEELIETVKQKRITMVWSHSTKETARTPKVVPVEKSPPFMFMSKKTEPASLPIHYCPPHLLLSAISSSSSTLLSSPSTFPRTTSQFSTPRILEFFNSVTLDIKSRVPPIHSLSLSLLEIILELASEASSSVPALSHRRETLRSASLVCPKWKPLAQMLLWRKVEIYTYSNILKLLECSDRVDYDTREVVFEDDWWIGGYRHLWTVLEKLKGVKQVEWRKIKDINGLCSDALIGLSDLETLILRDPDFAPTSPYAHPKSLNLPPNLRTLKVIGSLRHLSTLDYIASAPTITSLQIIQTAAHFPKTQTSLIIFFRSFFKRIAPQLLHLRYDFVSSNSGKKLDSSILSLLHLCTSLETLEIRTSRKELEEMRDVVFLDLMTLKKVMVISENGTMEPFGDGSVRF